MLKCLGVIKISDLSAGASQCFSLDNDVARYLSVRSHLTFDDKLSHHEKATNSFCKARNRVIYHAKKMGNIRTAIFYPARSGDLPTN